MNEYSMLKVGLTGGIGSGKSTVAYLFSLLKVPVYIADDRAKSLMVTDQELKRSIIDRFGAEVYRPDDSLNRKRLASLVFSDKEALEDLNALVHPAVGRDVKDWFEKQSGASYAIEEAALLVETGSHRKLDSLIVVTAPEEIRIQRVCTRDGVDASDVHDRMKHQAGEKKLVEHADFIIRNDGKHLLVPQVVSVDNVLRKASQNASGNAG